MPRARGANAIMALAFEATPGTPPTTGYHKMPFVSTSMGAERGLIESDLLGQGRAPADPTYDIVTNDGDVVVPLDNEAFGWWLRLLFGPPASVPFSGGVAHRFNAGKATLPSASIEVGHPEVPSFSTHYLVRANTLQINMQRSGLASATIGLIGKGETVPSGVSNAGDLAIFDPATNKRYAAASGAIYIDGVQIGEVTQAQISFSNNLEKDETIRPDGEINDTDPGMPSVSISLTTKFASLALYNKATAGIPIEVQINWAVGTNRGLGITIPRLFLPRGKRPISGPGGVQQEFRGIGAFNAASSETIAFQLANAIESYA